MTDIEVVGTPVESAEQIDINIPSVAVQRKLYQNKALNYIKEVGSFDWNLFGVVTVVEYPNGTRELVDGGHRRYLAQTCFPDLTHIPGVVLKVNDEQEAARLFHRFNGTVSKNVNKEEQFVAQVYGEETAATELAKQLQDCNLFVQSNELTVGSHQPGRKSIKIAKFREFIRKHPQSTKRAVSVMHAVFREPNVNIIVLQGIMTLIEFCERFVSVDWDKVEPDFVEFLITKHSLVPQSKMTYPQLRKDNHYGISVAYGMYCDYFDWCNMNDVVAPFPKKAIRAEYDQAGAQD